MAAITKRQTVPVVRQSSNFARSPSVVSSNAIIGYHCFPDKETKLSMLRTGQEKSRDIY